MNKQKILIPLDGSDFSRQIFATICTLFPPETVELFLLEVIVPTTRPTMGSDIVTASDMVASVTLSGGASYGRRQAEAERNQYYREEAIRHNHEDALSVGASHLEKAGYTIHTHTEIGDPVTQIINYAQAAEVVLIAMATHGRSGLGKLVLGSVAERVLRQSPVPVLLLRPSPEE